MKIGIITLPLHTNYGGILQAYALQTILEEMGHEVVVYQKINKPLTGLPIWKYPLAIGKQLLKNRLSLLAVLNKKKAMSIITQHTDRFIEDNINICIVKDLRKIPLYNVDAIIVGSDQIWRPQYVKRMWKTNIQNVFMKFASGWQGKRIAYAVSFGVDHWEFSDKETKECRELVKQFDAVSVREESAIQLCHQHLNIVPAMVLDPTLLLQSSDYIKLFKAENTPKNNGLLFCYILDRTPEKMNYIHKFSVEKNLKLSIIEPTDMDKEAPVEDLIIPSIEKWIRSFYDAEFVITDSFHGCVFSIIFNKKFIAIGNPERGLSRFISLLSELGLENNLVTDLNHIDIMRTEDKLIDYSQKLSLLRENSISFLNNCLKQ